MSADRPGELSERAITAAKAAAQAGGALSLHVEIKELDIQALAKTAQQADPAVERAIRAMLTAAYGTYRRDRERQELAGPGSEDGGDVCALCGAAGVLWKGLTPCSYGGKTFNAHLRCFEALTAGG